MAATLQLPDTLVHLLHLKTATDSIIDHLEDNLEAHTVQNIADRPLRNIMAMQAIRMLTNQKIPKIPQTSHWTSRTNM